jgi:hypothetical protein
MNKNRQIEKAQPSVVATQVIEASYDLDASSPAFWAEGDAPTLTYWRQHGEGTGFAVPLMASLF